MDEHSQWLASVVAAAAADVAAAADSGRGASIGRMRGAASLAVSLIDIRSAPVSLRAICQGRRPYF